MTSLRNKHYSGRCKAQRKMITSLKLEERKIVKSRFQGGLQLMEVSAQDKRQPKQVSFTPHRRMYASAIIAFDVIMTLTFDLWPWEHFQKCSLTQWIYKFHWNLSTWYRDIVAREVSVDGRTDGRSENTMPPTIASGGIKYLWLPLTHHAASWLFAALVFTFILTYSLTYLQK